MHSHALWQVSNQLGDLTDLMATVADMHGVKLAPDAGEDSYSWLPCLGGGQGTRQAIVHHSMSGVFSIRQGDWKLVLGLGSGGFSEPRKVEPQPGESAGQLHNLRRDPSEEDNLYLKHPEVVTNLKAMLERYQKEGRSRPA